MAKIVLKYVNSFLDRYGRWRHQMRVPGAKSFRLPGLPGSEEFREAYQAALARNGVSQLEIGASRTKGGTINAAVVAYYKHDSFTKALAPAICVVPSSNASAKIMARSVSSRCSATAS
jgi:hypothetical protein